MLSSSPTAADRFHARYVLSTSRHDVTLVVRKASKSQGTPPMPVTDVDAAIAAISTLDPLSDAQSAARDAIYAVECADDPFVDIHHLFSLYNTLYFRSLLLPRVEVSWSVRLTLCAGICELVKDDAGKYTRIRLKLSEPLLRYRPRSDVLNTLLHEAIHAYFFITTSWRHSRGDDGTGHGAGFLLLADAINNHGRYDVTVYHTFHDEVDSYRTHIWQCDGPCRSQAPFFGLVKRSMNRAPGKSDAWWKKHEEECGGTYTKIAEPDLTKDQIRKLGAMERAGRQKNKIDQWVSGGKTERQSEKEGDGLSDVVGASGAKAGGKKRRTEAIDSTISDEGREVQASAVACPICDAPIFERYINEHLDEVHPT